MRGQRYEINITVKDTMYKVEIIKNGWRMVTVGEDTYNKVLNRLNEIFRDRVRRNVVNDDTRIIERAIRSLRGYNVPNSI